MRPTTIRQVTFSFKGGTIYHQRKALIKMQFEVNHT